MPPPDHFHDLVILLALAAVAGAFATLIKQPLVIAYVAVGVAAGPSGFGWVAREDEVADLANLGIAVLLFVVGLRLDPKLGRRLGAVAVLAGLGQVLATTAIGYVAARVVGVAPLPAFYVALGLTFSSTIVVVKLLSDKREIDSVHGRLAVGVLIIQDAVAVAAMIVLASVGKASGDHPLATVALLFARGAALVVTLWVIGRFALPAVLRHVARSQELLVLFAIAWAATVAAAAEKIGLSREVGAFLAGVSIAGTPYREAIGTRLTSLRDFLLFFFFVQLGSHVEVRESAAQVAPALALSAFVLVAKPAIVFAIVTVLGYRRRTGFLAGIAIAQVSEFSLVLAARGADVQHVTPSVLSLLTLVAVVTIPASTYAVVDSRALWERLAPWLARVRSERKDGAEERLVDASSELGTFDVAVFGLGRLGGRLAAGLARRGFRVIGIDFDPLMLRDARLRGLVTAYGDAEDPELPATLPLANLRAVVCAIPVRAVSLALIEALRTHGFQGQVIATTHDATEIPFLVERGATRVLVPFAEAAEQEVAVVAADLARPAERSP